MGQALHHADAEGGRTDTASRQREASFGRCSVITQGPFVTIHVSETLEILPGELRLCVGIWNVDAADMGGDWLNSDLGTRREEDQHSERRCNDASTLRPQREVHDVLSVVR